MPRHADRALVLLIAASVAVALFPRVAAFTTDSESYLDVAANLLAGQGLVQRVVDFWRPAVPDPLGLWPPLYPAAIAAVALPGIPLEFAARLVSLLSFAAFALAFHALACRALGRWGAFATTVIVLTTAGIARAAVTAWSEMLFLALATTGFACLARLIKGRPNEAPGRSIVPATIAGVVIGLAALTRYVGVALVPLGLVLLLAQRARRATWLPWLLAAAAFPAAWLTHNVLQFGHPFGPGLPPSDQSVVLIGQAIVRGLRWGLLPRPIAALAPPALALLAALGIAVIVAWSRGTAARIAAAFTMTYLVLLLAARATVSVNDIGDRYLTPLYPFVWLCGAVALAAVAERGGVMGRIARGLSWLVVAAAVIGFLVTVRGLPAPSQEMLGREQDLIALRRLVPPGTAPVLSDAGHRLRSATGRAAVVIPGADFQPRPFNREDQARWRLQGVHEAVLRRSHAASANPSEGISSTNAQHPADPLGDYLRTRLGAEGPDAWTAIDSTLGFMLYRSR